MSVADHTLAILEGDGIGPEIVPAARRVVDAAARSCGLTLAWRELPMGAAALEASGEVMPASNFPDLEDSAGWLVGPHHSEGYPGWWKRQRVLPPTGVLRLRYDLYANVRPSRCIDGLRAAAPGLDVVVVRENTEGFYADRNMAVGVGEFMPQGDVALAVAVFKRSAVERVLRYGCDLARTRSGRVTVAHKANVLPLTTGMYVEVGRALQEEFPDLSFSYELADALAAKLVTSPTSFDVIVAENMIGDILSDLTNALSGGLGLGGSLNAGLNRALAQACHGSAPDIAGQGVANPVAMVRSGAMLLQWLGTQHGDGRAGRAAAAIDAALDVTISAGIRTPDLGGTASTDQVTRAVIDRLDPPTDTCRRTDAGDG